MSLGYRFSLVKIGNHGGAAGGNRKYPNEEGYVADQGIDLFDREEFDEVPDGKIARYNHRHSALAAQDYTAYAYALMTPVDKLIKIMQQVDKEAPHLTPNRFHPNDTPVQLEGDRYGKLVVAYHDKQRELNMDGLALQVSNTIMQDTYPSEALTKFIRNIEAQVFACMQTAPPQEINDNYGIPPSGRPDV